MRISPELKAALRQYFKTKQRNRGMFKTTAEKTKCLTELGDACKALGYGCWVVPGLVEVVAPGERRFFTERNWWIGTATIESALGRA